MISGNGGFPIVAILIAKPSLSGGGCALATSVRE
jgi:hypothetical protein